MAGTAYRWWLLIHQIPPRPPYLRTKIAKRLVKLDTVAVKSSVYVLPMSDSTLEDLQWVRREVVAGGGEAFVCEARFVDGLTEAETEGLFRTARDADYHALADELRPALAALKRRKKLDAEAREATAALLDELAARLGVGAQVTGAKLASADYQNRTWVTRHNIHVDRIACAWLIRRFVDPGARFVFVPGETYDPAPASCASTCSTPSSPTRAIAAASRCWSIASASAIWGCGRSPRSSTTSISRMASSATATPMAGRA